MTGLLLRLFPSLAAREREDVRRAREIGAGRESADCCGFRDVDDLGVPVETLFVHALPVEHL